MRIRVIGFLLSLFPAMGLGVVVPTLYQGEVAVASYSPSDWQKAIAPALSQVLVKVSGNPNITQVESIRNTLGRAGSFVQSYNYVARDSSHGKTMVSLQLRFSPKAVNNLLQQANQTVLPKDRPLTLVWIAIANAPAQPSLLNEESMSLMSDLQSEAANMALPLLWPSLDLQDLNAISARQVWSFDREAIAQASQRYKTDMVLIGKIEKLSNASWQGKWSLTNPQGEQAWQTYGASPKQVASNMLIQLASGIGKFLQQAATQPTQSIASLPPIVDDNAVTSAQSFPLSNPIPEEVIP